MIALDTSAIVAIALCEPEEEMFARIIAQHRAMIGAPTLLEARMVLDGRIAASSEAYLDRLAQSPSIEIVAFDIASYRIASVAFARFGRGRGHPARLNFGDCLSYAVAKTRSLPLLFKGDDFVHTDVVPAYTANS